MKMKLKLAAAGLAAVALALTSACGGGGGGGKYAGDSAQFPAAQYPKSVFGDLHGQLLWYDTSGGTIGQAREDSYFKDFTALTGVKSSREFTDGETTKLFNAVQQGGPVPWNMGQITNSDFYIAKAKGWLEPLDPKVIPMGDLNPGQADKYGVRHDIYGTVMFWNTKAFPKDKQPKDISALLDTKNYPGKRCFPQTFEGLAEIMLQADGVKPADVYPLDTARVFKTLDKIKRDTVWWNQADVATANMLNGECTIGITYAGRVYGAVTKNHYPLNASWNGSYISASWYVVPKGATDPKVGQAAISMVVRDKPANLKYVTDTTYPVDLKKLPLSSYPASVQRWLAIGKNAAQGVQTDGNWYAQHPGIQVQFQNWLVKG
ncbi:extracellular solute-binding protein [Streptomyces sp. NPDC004227]